MILIYIYLARTNATVRALALPVKE